MDRVSVLFMYYLLAGNAMDALRTHRLRDNLFFHGVFFWAQNQREL